MPELTREEKLKLVEKLPQPLQDLLYSEDTGAFLLYLGQKYNFPDEKVRLLSKLVADVVLGITPITSLAQEINSKITSDAQAAMNLAQELYAELLAPVMAPIPVMPPKAVPILPPTPSEQQNRGSTISQPNPKDLGEIGTKPVDEYRELTSSMPEIVDLRKMPPAVSKVEPPPAPVPPVPALPTLSPTSSEQQSRGSSIPQPNLKDLGGIGTAPVPTPTPKPVIPTPPLIEAEPHKILSAPTTPRPQYIMRPSGLPPTDLPENVLDLRKDRGEF